MVASCQSDAAQLLLTLLGLGARLKKTAELQGTDSSYSLAEVTGDHCADPLLCWFSVNMNIIISLIPLVQQLYLQKKACGDGFSLATGTRCSFKFANCWNQAPPLHHVAGAS